MEDTAGMVAAGLAVEAPELSATTLALTKRLARLQTLIEGATAATLGMYGLSRGEYDVLSTLRSAGSPYRLKPSDLSQRLLFTTGGVSNLLRSLTARGYLDRTPDPFDKRSYWVGLTTQGAEVAIAVVRRASAAQTRLLDGVAEPTLRRLVAGLADVLAGVDSESTGAQR